MLFILKDYDSEEIYSVIKCKDIYEVEDTIWYVKGKSPNDWTLDDIYNELSMRNIDFETVDDVIEI